MDAPRSSPSIALLVLARTVEVEVARILEPLGLSVRKLAVLQRLASVPGAAPADLARTIGVSADEVAPMLRALVTSGLVRRGRDGTLAITSHAAEALEQADAALARLDETTFATTADLAAELLAAVAPRSLGAPQD